MEKDTDQANNIEQLKKVNEELRNARKAALNLMEDAILSKEALKKNEENYRVKLEQEVRDRTAELNESREQFASLVANTPDIITRWNKNFEMIFANKAFSDRRESGIQQLFQYTQSRLSKSDDWTDILRRVFMTGSQIEHYHSFSGNDGEMQFYFRIVPEKNASGDIVTVLAIARDITDLRSTECEVLNLKDEIARKATDKYLNLFNTMDEGFVLIQLLYDENLLCTDYRYLEANPAFTNQLGLRLDEIIDKRAGELFKSPQDLCIEQFAALSENFPSVHFEQHLMQNEQWYEVSAFTVGNDQAAVLYTNITKRKKAEFKLRESEELKAYLLELSDALSAISDPVQIQNKAMAVLGERMKAAIAQFFEVDQQGKLVISMGGYSLPEHRLWKELVMDNFGTYLKELLAQGATVLVSDTGTDPRIDAEKRTNYAELGIRSLMAVPVIRDGKFIAGISIGDTSPRDWTVTEISMAEETSVRTWASIDRARAEIALHENQALLARELKDTVQLQKFSNKLIEENDPTIYDDIVLAAAEIMHADTGSLQKLTEDGKRLELLASKDFHPVSKEHWKYVDADSTSSCGHAFREQKQILITDIANPPYHINGRDLEAYQLSAIRAMQTTPLISRSGKFVGMISTHWKTIYHPSERELRFLDLLARQAADLLERKAAQDALRENEQRTRVLTDAVPQIIWTNDGKGKADFFNQRWYDYSGLTPAASIGRGWEAIVHPDDAAASKLLWHQALLSGEIYETEFRLRHTSGNYRWHICRNIPLKNQDGKIAGWFGSATDIDDLKKAEEGFRLSEARLKATMNAASDYAIITMDMHGLVLDWSHGAERIFGYTALEMNGKPASLIFTPEDINAGIPSKEMEEAQQSGSAGDERWHMRKDGSRFFMSGVTARLDQHEVSGFVKVARDMTQQRLEQENLQSLEERYRIALQSAEMAAWDWNITDDTIDWNDQHFILLGLQPDGKKKKAADFLSHIHPDDLEHITEVLTEAVQKTGIYKAEFRIVRADNKSVRWMYGYGRVMTYENDVATRMVGVMYDTTERKALEQQKEDFISIASHELKTPVTSIRAYADLLSDIFEDADDQSNALLIRKLSLQVDRLADLIHALLDTSKISFGQLTLNMETFDLNELIEECMEDLQRLSETHTLRFTPASESIITADRERIGQVLINLISNAIKYSSIPNDVFISCMRIPQSMQVSVRDKGPGIPPDMQTKIFERFFRLYEPSSSTQHGMGLGLYITKNIVERHGGKIWVESQPGQGSVFHFAIPVAEQESFPK